MRFHHSRPQRPQYFWPAPRIMISGQPRVLLKSDWLVKQRQEKMSTLHKLKKSARPEVVILGVSQKDHSFLVLKKSAIYKRKSNNN